MNDHFCFEIADNGIGMDQATQRNIFEEFFSTKGSAGTGLGLAVVEKVVNKHGGRIEIRLDTRQGKPIHDYIQINDVRISLNDIFYLDESVQIIHTIVNRV